MIRTYRNFESVNSECWAALGDWATGVARAAAEWVGKIALLAGQRNAGRAEPSSAADAECQKKSVTVMSTWSNATGANIQNQHEAFLPLPFHPPPPLSFPTLPLHC